MEGRRQRAIVLGGLVAVLAAIVWWQFGRPAADPEPVQVTGQAQTAAAGAGQAGTAVPQVLIALLDQPRSEPVDPGRDLFKFSTRTRPAEQATTPGGPAVGSGGVAPAAAGVAAPGAPTAPPPPPPIPLRFIGLVQKQGDPTKIAVLSDSRGVYYGREGDVIEGRYRIVRVGNESVEVAYVDGRGRQVLRLSGG